MYKWVKKNQADQMEFVHFDHDDGTLVVNIHWFKRLKLQLRKFDSASV